MSFAVFLALVCGFVIGYFGRGYPSLTSQWLAAIGTISVAFLAVFSESFKNSILAPVLEVDTSAMRFTRLPVCGKTAWIVNLRIKPRIWKFVPAQNCRVFLWEVIRDNGNRFEIFHPFYWTPASTEDQTHKIGREGWPFALGCLWSDNLEFEAKWLVTNPYKEFTQLRANQNIIYGLRIFADNFESSESECVRVDWDGTWSDDEPEMRKHLTIRKVVCPSD